MFIITTPNPQYTGITAGVQFENGVAYIEDDYLRKVLVRDYGYADESKPQPAAVTDTQNVEAPPAAAKSTPKQRRTSAKTSAK